MVVNKIDDDNYEVSLFWDDLSSETQNELLHILGENGNYDVVPISVFMISNEGEL